MTITRQLPRNTALLLLLLVGVLMYSSEQSNKMLGQLVRSSMTAPLSHTKTDGRVIESDNTRAVHLHKSRKRGQIPLSILTHDDPSLSSPPPLVPVHDRIASANRIDISAGGDEWDDDLDVWPGSCLARLQSRLLQILFR